jgi:hypothetical protein
MFNIKKSVISQIGIRVLFAAAWFAMAGNGALAGQKLHFHVPEGATNTPSSGRLTAGTVLNFSISLPLRNDAELTKFLEDLNESCESLFPIEV